MIEVRQLTKRFGDKVAVDGITFEVGKGEVLGFLGPNAAGKSTTMRMITGYLPPTSGTAVIGGHDIIEASMEARKRIGYLPENAPAYPDMTVKAFLEFMAEIRGLGGGQKRRRVDETIERCFLREVRNQPISTLSKGYNQRVCFAQAIIHDPEYLIMDEPTDGLDPNQKFEVRSMIRQMARQKTIILSTHNLEEVDVVCTRVIIISGGRIVADRSPDELKAMSALAGAAYFTVSGAGEEVLSSISGLEGVKEVKLVESTPGRLSAFAYPVRPGAPIGSAIVGFCMAKGYVLETMKMEEGRLDEVFRLVTKGPEAKGEGL